VLRCLLGHTVELFGGHAAELFGAGAGVAEFDLRGDLVDGGGHAGGEALGLGVCAWGGGGGGVGDAVEGGGGAVLHAGEHGGVSGGEVVEVLHVGGAGGAIHGGVALGLALLLQEGLVFLHSLCFVHDTYVVGAYLGGHALAHLHWHLGLHWSVGSALAVGGEYAIHLTVHYSLHLRSCLRWIRCVCPTTSHHGDVGCQVRTAVVRNSRYEISSRSRSISLLTSLLAGPCCLSILHRISDVFLE